MTRYRVFVLWPILHTTHQQAFVGPVQEHEVPPCHDVSGKKEHTQFISRTDDNCGGGAWTQDKTQILLNGIAVDNLRSNAHRQRQRR